MYRPTALSGAFAVTIALVIASCGGGGSDPASDDLTNSTVVDDAEPTPESAEPTPPTDDASSNPDDPDTTMSPPAAPSGDASWSGGDIVELLDARLDELEAAFGQPATPDAVADLFEMPADFPYPDGTVTGVMHRFDRDLRVTDEIDIDELRIVGVDGPRDEETFEALFRQLLADGENRWDGASSQRGVLNNDLYTADDGNGGTDRFVITGNPHRDPGEAKLKFKFEATADAIPVPDWQAGLPLLEGGELTELTEARGLVDDFGTTGQDGHVEVRYLYPVDRFDELEAFFESGIVAAAGFAYEDTPFSNFNLRIDVSVGDWEGIVAVGEASVNGELVGYDLLWSLTRAADPAAIANDDPPAPAAAETTRPDVTSGLASSPAAPVPIAGATFDWDDGDVQWQVELAGTIETPSTFDSEENGCINLFGVMTPSFLDADVFATRGIDTPDFGIIAGGEYFDTGSCDDTDAILAGFDPIAGTSAILGAPINFVASLLAEGTDVSSIETIVVGDPGDDLTDQADDDEGTTYFTVDSIAAIPQARPAPADLVLPQASPLAGTTTSIGSNEVWQLLLHGLVPVPATPNTIASRGPGACLALLGEATPTLLDQGELSNDEPTLRLVANGLVLTSEFNACELDELNNAGYESIGTVNVAVGTPASFAEAYFIPDALAGTVTTVVVDDRRGAEPQFFSADAIDVVPPLAAAVTSTGITTSGSIDSAPISYRGQDDEIEWTITSPGIVDAGPTTDGRSECFVVVGSMTPDEAVDSQFDAPDVWLIAQGVGASAANRLCDTSAVESAGYSWIGDIDVAAGEAFDFYVPVHIPVDPAREVSAIAFGDPFTAGDTLYFDPVVLATAPPA